MSEDGLKVRVQDPNNIHQLSNSHKRKSDKESGRGLLNALARKISTLYDIIWGIDHQNAYPTIGDVFYAKEYNDWEHMYRWPTLVERRDEGLFGSPDFDSVKRKMCEESLPNLFTTEEWEKLKYFDKTFSDQIHKTDPARTTLGEAYIVLPQEDYNQENVAFFKSIAVKSHLFMSEDGLKVRGQTDLSGI
jgi:hypothetical protein